jgi:predicted metal-dependent peptidase
VNTPPAVIRKSRLRLILDQPYLASSVAAFQFVDGKHLAVETMATDGSYIFYNLDWCEKLSDSQLDFVLAHEVLHCLLGHIDRRKDRIASVWNIAIDYATNLLLVAAGFPHPGMGLFDHNFSGLSAERIYDLLINRDLTESRQQAFDAHFDQDSAELASLGLERLSSHGRERFRKLLQLEARGLFPGRSRAMLETEIDSANSNAIPWTEYLSRFFSGLSKSDYRMFPFNRKHLWNELYLPSLGVPGPEHLVVAIDTSGSMSQDQISVILGEIFSLRNTAECSITVVQCDDQVRAVQTYEPWDMWDGQLTIFGRGGTDFTPIFEYLERGVPDQPSPDALILLTDGFGHVHSAEPPYSVLWVLTSAGQKPVDWGESIKLPD